MPYVFSQLGITVLVGPSPQPHRDSTRATQVSFQVVYGKAV
jgi:hypothetical protein